MQLDHTAYEQTVRAQAQLNRDYLAGYESALEAVGTSVRRIKRELRNVSSFLNDYLLHEDDPSAEMGCYLVDDYMEGFVIERCAWATPAAIAHNGESLVGFYRWMFDTRHVDEDAFEELQATIEAQMPLWQEECAQASTAGNVPSAVLLGAIQDTVTQSMAEPGPTGMPSHGTPSSQTPPSQAPSTPTDAIDLLALSILHLAARDGRADPWNDALVRLRQRGLITNAASHPGNATAIPSLTPHGEAEAARALAATGLSHLSSRP